MGFPGSSAKEPSYNAGVSGSIPELRSSPGKRDRPLTPVFWGFPGGSDGKEYACNAGDLGLTPGLGRSLEKGTLSTPVFWPGEFHRLYSPWGRKELDTTELSLTFLFHRAVCQD